MRQALAQARSIRTKYQEQYDNLHSRLCRYVPDGLQPLFFSGKIKLRGADSARLRRQIDAERVKRAADSERYLRRTGKEPTYEGLSDAERREDEVLRLVTRDGKPSSVVIYGGLHDFRGSVKRWNDSHPDAKVSLVVVTPEAYRQLESKR